MRSASSTEMRSESSFMVIAPLLTITRLKSLLERTLANLVDDERRTDSEIYHEVQIQHWTAEEKVVNVFGVLHSVAGSVNDGTLEKWASSEKLFPWVAIAAPLKVCLCSLMEDWI